MHDSNEPHDVASLHDFGGSRRLRWARVTGETEHEKGRQGAQMAKRWLDFTTRVNVQFVNPDPPAVKKLTVKKANPKGASVSFSFDLGGYFRGGEYENEGFVAECKNYAKASDLKTHYRAFLAHCYRAYATEKELAEHFFWISFSPHSSTTWDELTTFESVKSAVLHKDQVDVNFPEGVDAASAFDPDIANAVADRIWILILSKRQVKHLTLTSDHYVLIESAIAKRASEQYDNSIV